MRATTWPGAAGALMFLLLADGPALAGENLVLASGRSDTPAFAAAVGLSSLIKFELLPTEKIDLQTLESSGAVDSMRRLQAGDAELAIVPSVIGHAARLGMGSFAGDPPETAVRAIATLWRDALHLVVREDDVTTGTIDDLAKLKKRKLLLGEASTGTVDANRLLFADLGMDADQSFELATIADGDGVAAIKRGEVDAFSATARPPEAMFEGLFKDDTSRLRLLDVTETQLTRANGNHWLWTPYLIPAATYPGQGEDVWTIAFSNLLVARADVDPDVVYAMTKSIFENLAYLKRVDALMTDLSLETALAGMSMPLHPGALRYYQESGLISKPGSEGLKPAPTVTPVGQETEQPAVTPEQDPVGPKHYPDGDVAGDWPTGAGGPLMTTEPERIAPAPATSEPHWRQRATL
ncbi:MAG: TAXI family TRAP transporter solute-binding subunit [Alphaproteobacteria bacterium]|nr:TAXI family TRAP transporter solute-binding subunit [Alphaproteobacteria bacterium]